MFDQRMATRSIAAVVGVAALVALAGCNSDKEAATQASPTVDQSAIDAAVADALAKQAASVSPAASSSPESTPSTTPESEESSVNFTMPNFVGMNLQDAQNKVQTYGVFYSKSHDLNGSRMQMLDSNWKVCDQNIKPGTKIQGSADDYEGEIDFGTVKVEEDCP